MVSRESHASESSILDAMSRVPIDPDLLARVREYDGSPLPLGHHFTGVAGHPDDDECTFRADGTDATYCGEPLAVHESLDSVPEGDNAR